MATKHALSPISSTFGPAAGSLAIQQRKRQRTSEDTKLPKSSDNIVLTTSSASNPRLDQLPAELLQQIAWYAINPLIYLVSKAIHSKLLPCKDYEHDLICLLWCDRSRNALSGSMKLGWASVASVDFPWRTPVAKRANPSFDLEQRLNLQKQAFQVGWFTASKLFDKWRELIRFWIEYHWSDDCFKKKDEWFRELVDTSDILYSHRRGLPLIFRDEHNAKTHERGLQLSLAGVVDVVEVDEESDKPLMYRSRYIHHQLMDTLYIPPWIFTDLRCSEDDLLPFLCYSRPYDAKRSMRRARADFSHQKAFVAIRRAIQHEDWIAFIRLFCLLLNELTDHEAEHLPPSIVDLIFLKDKDGNLILWQLKLVMDGRSLSEFRRTRDVSDKNLSLDLIRAVKSLDDLKRSLITVPKELEIARAGERDEIEHKSCPPVIA